MEHIRGAMPVRVGQEMTGDWNDLSGSEREELAFDISCAADIEIEHNYSPFGRASGAALEELYSSGEAKSSSFESVYDPPLNKVWNDALSTPVARWKSASSRIERVGCRASVETTYGNVERTVWVRNFESYSVDPMFVSREIAEYIAWGDALRLVRRHRQKVQSPIS